MKQGLIRSIFLTLFFIGLFIKPAYTALIIEPALIKVNLTQNRASGTFVLKNTGAKEVRYRAQTVHFVVTAEGNIKKFPPDDYSLVDWIKFNPKEFTLPPQSSRMVRYSIIPQGKLKPREYWCAIEFMPLEAMKLSSEDKEGRKYNIGVFTAVMVPFYAYVEGTSYSGKIEKIEVKKDEKTITSLSTVACTGEGLLRLDGNCQVIDSSGKIVEDIPLKSIAVFPKNKRIIKTKFKEAFASGKYTLRLSLISIDPRAKINLSQEKEFDI